MLDEFEALPLYQGQYDIRWLVMCLKKMLGTDQVTLKDLSPMNPLHMKKEMQGMLDFVNATPTTNWDDSRLY